MTALFLHVALPPTLSIKALTPCLSGGRGEGVGLWTNVCRPHTPVARTWNKANFSFHQAWPAYWLLGGEQPDPPRIPFKNKCIVWTSTTTSNPLQPQSTWKQSDVGHCLCVETQSADELQPTVRGRGKRTAATAFYCNPDYVRGRTDTQWLFYKYI